MRHKPSLRDGIAAFLIVCAAVALLHPLAEGLWSAVHRPKAVAPVVNGFMLLEAGFSGRAQPFFGIAYATQAPYEYVAFGGETVVPTRSQSVVVFPKATRSRYLVKETLLAVDRDGETRESLLSIFDTETGKEVASRKLRRGQIEDQTGWVGSHALKFVRTVLPPPTSTAAPFRYWSEVKEHALLKSHALPLTEAKPFQFVTQNCPPDSKIARYGYPGQLAFTTATWRFIPHSPLNGAFCIDRYVVVVSSIFPGTPYVDVLRRDGTHLGTMELGIPGDLLMQGAKLAAVENGHISGQTLSFEIHYMNATLGAAPMVWMPFQRTEVQLTVPEVQ